MQVFNCKCGKGCGGVSTKCYKYIRQKNKTGKKMLFGKKEVDSHWRRPQLEDSLIVNTYLGYPGYTFISNILTPRESKPMEIGF